jgi:hypothetical protein
MRQGLRCNGLSLIFDKISSRHAVFYILMMRFILTDECVRRGLPESCPFLGKSCGEFASVARPGGVAQRVRTPSSQKGDDKGMDRPRFSAPNQRLNVGLRVVFFGDRE